MTDGENGDLGSLGRLGFLTLQACMLSSAAPPRESGSVSVLEKNVASSPVGVTNLEIGSVSSKQLTEKEKSIDGVVFCSVGEFKI